MNLDKNLNLPQKFSLTEQEKDQVVMYGAKIETFETYKEAKTYFDNVCLFCRALWLTLEANTKLWVDERDACIKMMFSIRWFEGKIAQALENDLPNTGLWEDFIDTFFGGMKKSK